jgi:hypothetical protein
MGRAFIFLIPLFLTGIKAQAIDISAAGGWNESVDQSDLIFGPGSELIEVYESTTGGTVMDVANCTDDSDNWRIDVRRIDDGGWHEDLILYLREPPTATAAVRFPGDFPTWKSPPPTPSCSPERGTVPASTCNTS